MPLDTTLVHTALPLRISALPSNAVSIQLTASIMKSMHRDRIQVMGKWRFTSWGVICTAILDYLMSICYLEICQRMGFHIFSIC